MRVSLAEARLGAGRQGGQEEREFDAGEGVGPHRWTLSHAVIEALQVPV